MLLAARDANVKRVRLCRVVVGLRQHPELPKREDMRPTPLSPYALQKLVGEQYGRMFHELYGLKP